MGWLGGMVVGFIIGWIAQAWWSNEVEQSSAKRRPSIWLRRKSDDRLYRRDGYARERDGNRRHMIVLYDCEAAESELWPNDVVQSDFRSVEYEDSP